MFLWTLLSVLATLHLSRASSGTLLFKPTHPKSSSPSLSSSSASSWESFEVSLPSRLPTLDDDVLFSVPFTEDPLLLRATRSFDHPENHGRTLCGVIVDPETKTRVGVFTMSCQMSKDDSLKCLANVRPDGSGGNQYELRHDPASNAHQVKVVNSIETYEDMVVRGDFRSDSMTRDRLAKDKSMAKHDNDASSVGEMPRRRLKDTNDILDIFIVWTPEAEAVVGGGDAMSLYMDFVVDEANHILENSQIELRLRVVSSMRMADGSYTEPGTDLGTILNQATDYAAQGEPEFDAEQAKRYDLNADAFVVIAGHQASSQCGIAWVKSSSSFPASYTVSVSALNCLSGYGTFMHELGHNLGCAHDPSVSSSGDGLYSYSLGYCWDRSTATSCDGTCGRSTMAYSQCTSPLGCTGCNKHDYFSNPDVYQAGSPVGKTSQNNALTIMNSRADAIALQDSSVEGGLIFSIETNHVSVNISCFTIDILGWNIGSGSDITSVTVAGVVSTDITEQTRHSVSANIMAINANPGRGDVVVSSSRFDSTLTNGFTFDPPSKNEIFEDFQSGLDVFYQGDDSIGWYYFNWSCPTGSGEICEDYGPASGDGMFALARVDGSGRDATFDSQFSSGLCVDTVSAISVKYYAYSTASQCYSSNILSIRVQYEEGGDWTTIASTSSIHSNNHQSWKSLSASGFESVLYGIQIRVSTSSPLTNCDYWNPVAVDDISVTYSTECDCSNTMSPTITYAPTGVPSTSSPTPNVTASSDDDDDSLFGIPRDLLPLIGIGAGLFFCIMGCLCCCDLFRSRRKEQREARRREQHRARDFGVEFSSVY